MGNVKSVSEKFENLRSFLNENWLERKLAKMSQHATQVSGVPSISAETLAFLLYRQD